MRVIRRPVGTTIVLVLPLFVLLAGCTRNETPRSEASPSPKPEGPDIVIADAWARESVAMSSAAAVFMTIRNNGSVPDSLLSATIDPPIAERVELHETVPVDSTIEGTSSPHGGGESMGEMDGMKQGFIGDESEESKKGAESMGKDAMTMRKIESIEIPAGKTVKLEPGGLHVMLKGLSRKLEAGERIRVSLVFRVSGKKDVWAEVKPV